MRRTEPRSARTAHLNQSAERTLATVLAASLLVLGACGDGTGPFDGAARLESLVPTALSGTVGERLPEPIRVRVSDGRGRALSGVEVVFKPAFADGSLTAVTNEGTRSTDDGKGVIVTSDPAGLAEAIWELGPVAGSQQVSASGEGLAALELSAEAAPAAPAAFIMIRGQGQMAGVGSQLGEQLVVALRDRFGNRVPDAVVSWSVTAGDGSLSATTTVTDAVGETSTEQTLGASVGLNIASARYGELDAAEFASLGVTYLDWDAEDDTFSVGISGYVVHPDLTGLGAGWTGDELVVGLLFEQPMAAMASRQRNRFGGALDFDLDLDSSTGLISAVDVNRPNSGSTGMGVDLYVDLFGTVSADYIIVDDRFQVLGLTTPGFYGRLVVFAVPGRVLGSGPLNIAAVVSTHREATDIAPNDGSLRVGARP